MNTYIIHYFTKYFIWFNKNDIRSGGVKSGNALGKTFKE